jgi:hypothetical protein
MGLLLVIAEGSGPGINLLNGGANPSQHLMKLGTSLSDMITVYIPDRHGHGLSGLSAKIIV